MSNIDTKTRVLKAAGPIFAEKGFEAATVREICDAAGTNLASVNYHFGDKERLYIETIRHAHELRMKQVPMREIPASTPPEEGLRIFVSAMLHRMLRAEEEPWQARLMMREMLAPTGACVALVEDFIRPQVKQLLSVLKPLIPVDLADQQRMKIVFSVVGQCLHYKAAWPIVQMLIPPPDLEAHFDVDSLAQHITDFTLGSLKALREASPGSPLQTATHHPQQNPQVPS